MDSPFGLLDLVSQHEGFAVLVYPIVHKSVTEGELTALPITDPFIERNLSTVLPVNRPVTKAMREVEREITALAKDYKDKAKWHMRAGTLA